MGLGDSYRTLRALTCCLDRSVSDLYSSLTYCRAQHTRCKPDPQWSSPPSQRRGTDATKEIGNAFLVGPDPKFTTTLNQAGLRSAVLARAHHAHPCILSPRSWYALFLYFA